MSAPITFYIPAKGSSQRIPTKNLQSLNDDHTLLSWTLAKLRRWYPDCRIVVATDSDSIREASAPYSCEFFSLTPTELEEIAIVGFLRYLREHDSRPAVLVHPTSPFTFRSEFETALRHPTPVVVSGLFILPSPPDDYRQSQTKEAWCQLTGNFIIIKESNPPPDSTWLSRKNMSLVSHLASFDIDFPHEMEEARRLTREISLAFFDN
jgi:hypothetical protein